ncbi:MAG: ABC transporter ATP-binding protein [Candidatus Heimdallarchaeota archaeon]|nr:ABC transporter ATP-binding protein [Candidatus Heimdallarchaeota archaeon]
MSKIVVETQGLTKEFDGLYAVNGLSLKINESEIFGLLGPNGAGKTTTVRLLTGMLEPSSGNASVLGLNSVTQSNQIRERVGILTETPSLYQRLSVRDNLDFFAKVHDIPKEERDLTIKNLVKQFDIADKENEAAGKLSKGMRQKVAIARAIIHSPVVLFLDEPTGSLSPKAAKMVRDLIVSLTKNENRTVFINTHNLSEAEKLCSRVGILEKGRLIAIGKPSELRSLLQSDVITVFRFKKWDKQISDYFSTSSIKITDEDKEKLSVTLKLENIEESTPIIIKDLSKLNIDITEVRHNRPDLEQIYLKLVNGDNHQDEMEESK